MSANTKPLKEALRNPYAWPGGYERRIYLSDGEPLCHDCARTEYRSILHSTRNYERDGWAFGFIDIPWEGPPDYCAQCGKEMPTVCGDPDNPEA